MSTSPEGATMSFAYLTKRLEERAALSDLATAVLDKCAEDSREPTNEEQSQLDNWAEQVKKLDAEIKRLEAMVNGNEAFKAITDRVGEANDEADERRSAKKKSKKHEERQVPKTIGQRFVESDAFKNYEGRGSSGAVEFEGFLETRAAITTADVPIPPYIYEQTGYQLTTPVLNVLGREVVTVGSVEWFTWGGSNAEKVPEGELKPEATITPTKHTGSLETFAHWKAITRQTLEDYARIQSIVETKLRDGLGNALEAEAVRVLTADTNIPEASGADLLTAVRLAIGEVESHTYRPNAILMNPADFAQADLDAATGAGNGPVGWSTFWGVPVVSAGAIPAGTAYVGDFKAGETWFDHNSAAVYMTDSHADYFVRNMLVILAEQRSLFAVTEPLAIAKATTGAPAVQSTRSSK